MQMTFTELRTEGQRLWQEAISESEAYEKEVAKANSSGYAPWQIDNWLEKYNAGLAESRNARADNFKEKVDALIADARENLNKMLSTAPTAEQVNLLNAIQFRGDTVEANEYESIAAQLSTSYQALKTLQSIAQKNGVRIHLPRKLDYQVLLKGLDWTETYLAERIHRLRNFTSARKADPLDRLFFGEGWADNLYAEHAVDLFD